MLIPSPKDIELFGALPAAKALSTRTPQVVSSARPVSRRCAALTGIIAEMTAGLLLRAGSHSQLAGLDAADSDRAFAAAEHRYGLAGATVRDVAREILDLTGLPDPGNSPGRIQAAFSSGTGTDILVSSANAAFMRAYKSSPDTTEGWVNVADVADFKTNRRARVTTPAKLSPLPRGGEAEHVALDLAGAESYRATRFARQIVIDEIDLVDQDIQAIVEPMLLLGRAAARLKLDLVYSVLLANASMADGVALFHSSHANLNTSAALAQATLDSAIKAMMEQTENGAPINVTPRFLIVPANLEGSARRLLNDRLLTVDDAPALVVEPRLGLGVDDPVSGSNYAGSNTSWYLAAGDDVPTVEFGRRTAEPEISSFTLTEGRWGLGIQLNWDCGAAALDFRGLQKNTA